MLPRDELELVLSHVDVHTLCIARMVNSDFRAAAGTCVLSHTVPGASLPLLDVKRYNPKVKVAVRPLYIHHIRNLSPPCLQPHIASVVLELDLATTVLQEVGDAMDLLASLPNLHCLEVKGLNATNAWRGERGITDEMLVQTFAPLVRSASLRELRTSCVYWQCDLQTLTPMSQLTLLTLGLATVKKQGGECECVAGLSNLRVLRIESKEAPQGFVTQLPHLEQLRWATSEKWVRASPFLASLTTLPQLRSLDVNSGVRGVSLTPEDMSPILKLTGLTCLSMRLMLREGDVCSLDSLSRLVHLKIHWQDDGEFSSLHKGLGAVMSPLTVPSGFCAIHDWFSPLSRLTCLTHLELAGDKSVALGWANLKPGEFISRTQGRLPLEKLRSLELTVPWLAPDTVSHILVHAPLLTSFKTNSALRDSNIAVLAGMTRLRALSFIASPSASEGYLLRLTSLSLLTHLTCKPLLDDPQVWPTCVTPMFVATMKAALSKMGWPYSSDFSSARPLGLEAGWT